MKDDEYFNISMEKINEWENLISTGTLTANERKVLRNRISAQKSRNKKKEELGGLSS